MCTMPLASVAPVVLLFVLTGPMNVASAEPVPPGTVQIDGDRLTYVAAAGTLNDVRVTGGPSAVGEPVDFVLTDTAGLRAGPGCTQVRRVEVQCSVSGVMSLFLDGGDRPDFLHSFSALPTTSTVAPGTTRSGATARRPTRMVVSETTSSVLREGTRIPSWAPRATMRSSEAGSRWT